VVNVFFECHASSVDNESGLASGHHDPGLSGTGFLQAAQLGERYAMKEIDAVFCSDLQRSCLTAEIAFGEKDVPIIRDKRLREWDYGDLSGFPREQVDSEKLSRISRPFPNGESCEQAVNRVRGFLEEVLQSYKGRTVLIIGHSATWYALEHWINDTPLDELAGIPRKWQPGWTYSIESV